jgi:hypothetical protein
VGEWAGEYVRGRRNTYSHTSGRLVGKVVVVLVCAGSRALDPVGAQRRALRVGQQQEGGPEAGEFGVKRLRQLLLARVPRAPPACLPCIDARNGVLLFLYTEYSSLASERGGGGDKYKK